MLRRRRGGLRQPGSDEAASTADQETGDLAVADARPAESDEMTGTGPWDSANDYPQTERIDCGSLLVPMRDGFDIQINVAEEQGVWVAVVHGESGMQLQAFAAPRSGGLWDEVRHEIAANIAEAGGICEEVAGPLGTDLLAEVPAGEAGGPDADVPPPQPVRFVGADGSRWFLRGVLSGPAARDRVLAAPFEELFTDVVVVRGDYPAPPKEQLEIRLPEEARQALETQFADENPGWDLPNPFERGPEITEIR